MKNSSNKLGPSGNTGSPKTAKAVPKGAKPGYLANKRPTATKTTDGGRAPDASFIATQSRNVGATVGDDGAGTRSRMGLPPETAALKAPAAEIPAGVQAMAAEVLPLPDANMDPQKLGMVKSWDYARDMKLGKQGSR